MIEKDKFIRYRVQAKFDITAYDCHTGSNYNLSVIKTLNTSKLDALLALLKNAADELDKVSETIAVPESGESDA